MEKPRVYITGGAGFIGSHVVDLFVAADWHVTVLDNLSTGDVRNVNSKAEFLGPCDCGALLEGKLSPDSTLVHLAAHPRCNASLFAPVADAQLNYLVGLQVLVAAVNSRVKRVVLVSSMSVYGDAHSPYKEDDIPLPREPYAINKRALEMVVACECAAHDIEWTIVRPQHVFGRRQRSDLTYRNVVARWCRLMLKEMPLPVYGTLDLKRAFSPVSLIARGIYRAATEHGASGQIFNLGTRRVRTLRELSEWIASEIGVRNVCFELKAPPPTLLEEAIGDVSKMEHVLGVREEQDEAGRNLRELVDEVRSESRESPEFVFNPEVLRSRFRGIYGEIGQK